MVEGGYGRELTEIAAWLHRGDVSATVRGDAAARLVFVECGQRAAELSRDGQDWWVEFWAGEAVAADRSLLSAGDAVQAVAVWLAPDADPDAAADGGA